MNDEETSREVDAFLRDSECVVKVKHEKTLIDCVGINFAVQIFTLRAKLQGHPHEYSRHAVHSAVRRGFVTAIAVGTKTRYYYTVESLKQCAIFPLIPGKPIQKTQPHFRPPHEGYPSHIKEHARRFFAGQRLNAEHIERLCAYRGSKDAGRTRIRQRPTLSNRAIADYLNMVYGRGDDEGLSGMKISYRTIQEWYYEWQKEQNTF